MQGQLIPNITPDMYRKQPDQTTEILNTLIDEINDNRALLQELYEVVVVLQRKVEELEPEPTPPGPTDEYRQLIPFDPSQMGTQAGWCLKNCRLGFGIQNGTNESAYADMIYNRNHGTLHEEIYPPVNIQVPIYIRTNTDNQHVVVWDQGTVYSDGRIIDDFVDYYGANNIYGWGELMDTVRVVEKVE